MPPDQRIGEDPIWSRVARARPALPVDLCPPSARTAAIAERILASPHPAPSSRTDDATQARPPRRSRPRIAGRDRGRRRGALLGAGGLTIAAACASVILVLSGSFSGSSTAPALADVIHIKVSPMMLPTAEQQRMDSTRLGRTITREFGKIQIDTTTGTAAQNRRTIAALSANRLACEQAARAVGAVPVPASGTLHASHRAWVQGIRLQALGDAQMITALRASDAGHRALGKRLMTIAENSISADDLLTGWAENLLSAPPAGPRPRTREIRLSPAARRILR